MYIYIFLQPSLVNEQLGQLYLDLQLEGVAARLTLEEGITSSSSSGEDSFVIPESKVIFFLFLILSISTNIVPIVF